MIFKVPNNLPVPVHRLKKTITISQTSVKCRRNRGLRISESAVEIDEVVQILFSAVPKIIDLYYLPDAMKNWKRTTTVSKAVSLVPGPDLICLIPNQIALWHCFA
jgi:hypothetical protein